MELVTISLRTIFFYFLIIIVYRIMGKREVGQLGIIDLIVYISMADLFIISIENYDDNILYSIIPILTLTALQVILAFITLRLPSLRGYLDGNPSVIIDNGKLKFKEMLKQKYNLDDLLVQLREQGYRSIEEIEYAVLETSGQLSIFSKEHNSTPFPLPLILDGKIQDDTLKGINKDKNWVIKSLKNKKLKLEDIFYAFYKEKSIYIIKVSDL
ncbi:MAG: DUF421 domain-containing protein [bacterium]|nr:DUF421 domain-containing protein [bacterium]